MTMAVTEERGGYGARDVRLEARHDGEEFVLSGRKFFVPDAHVAALARAHGIRTIYTRDRDFRKFPFLLVVDPVG